ncbi:MAG: hypothetical protein HY812_16265 [Planctomycetes bacterium]|nr:hypothetical protein [Planctomycetota bacterium]
MAATPGIRKAAAVFILAAGVACVAVGRVRSHEVRVLDADELAEVLGVAPFDQISEAQLAIDATFTGVTRKEGGLYSTYDRSAPRSKRACPT